MTGTSTETEILTHHCECLVTCSGPIPDELGNLQQLGSLTTAGTGLSHDHADNGRPPTGIDEPSLLPSFLVYDR